MPVDHHIHSNTEETCMPGRRFSASVLALYRNMIPMGHDTSSCSCAACECAVEITRGAIAQEIDDRLKKSVAGIDWEKPHRGYTVPVFEALAGATISYQRYTISPPLDLQEESNA